jgi:hypothetical protein
MGCDMKTSGVIDAFHDLGLDPLGQVDGYQVLMDSIHGLTGPARYDFPPGRYVFSRPIIAGPHAPMFRGAGENLTTLAPTNGRMHPVLVFGLHEVDGPQNNQVTAAHRPDAYGKLDSTLVNSAGVWHGLRTMGTIWGTVCHHPFALGSISAQSGDKMYTYHAEDTGWTFEAAITFNNGFPGNDLTLFGLGSAISAPMPWVLQTTAANQFIFLFKTNDQSAELNTQVRAVWFDAPTVIDATTVIRLRIWIDWTAGTLGVAINGTNVPITWGGAGSNIIGRRFQENANRSPFMVGATEDYAGGVMNVPDFTVWGMRTSCIARKTEGASDLYRYYDWGDTNTVAFFPGTGPPARDLDMKAGQARGNYNYIGSMFLISATGMSGGIQGGGVTDLSIVTGSPGIMIAQVLTPFSIERVSCTGGILGIGSLLPLGPCYTIRMNDVTVNGIDAGLSLLRCEVLVDGLECERGGITSFRFLGGNMLLKNLFIAFFHQRAQTAFEFYNSSWGSVIFLDFVNIDTEASGFSAAVFRIEQSAYVGSQLVELRRLSISGTGSVPLVQLKGHPRPYNSGSPWQMGVFLGEQWTLYSTDYTASLDVQDGWYGTVDVRNLKNTITGSGAGNIEVVSATTMATSIEAPGPVPDHYPVPRKRKRSQRLPWFWDTPSTSIEPVDADALPGTP